MESTLKPLAEIIRDLSKPIKKEWLKNKTMGGSKITFCPWYRVAHLMDEHAPGWQKEITNTIITGTHIIHTVRVSVLAAEGTFYREATGIEALKVSGYGDPSSNAESMAFRRACANWGLGAHLYEKDEMSLEHGEEAPEQPKKMRKASGDGQAGAPPELSWEDKAKMVKAKLHKAVNGDGAIWNNERNRMDVKTREWPDKWREEVHAYINELELWREENATA